MGVEKGKLWWVAWFFFGILRVYLMLQSRGGGVGDWMVEGDIKRN